MTLTPISTLMPSVLVLRAEQIQCAAQGEEGSKRRNGCNHKTTGIFTLKIIQKNRLISLLDAVWKSIGQALASEFGPEEGLRLFHLVSKWHPDYDPTECNEMFDWCIKITMMWI